MADTFLRTKGTVLQGLRSPRALVIDLEPSVNVDDLSVVTAASLKVYRAGDVIEVWTCAMSNKTADTLTLTHPWVEGDNDTADEELRIYAQLTIAGETIEVALVVVTVIPR